MIDDLDKSLKAMIQGEATPGSSLATAEITFAVPDEQWQSQGTGMQLDVYLYRILDNRELRSNQRTTVRNPDGSTTTQLFPARLECSYLITAWNKASDVAGVDKEPGEHALLDQLIYVLWRNPTMPLKYLTGSIANPELPLPILAAETEDMAAKPDFWSALDTYVRPAITCRITVEMDLNQNVVGSQATTIATSLMPNGNGAGNAPANATGDSLVLIGGIVRNAAAPTVTIANAWILLDSSQLTYTSDADGAFRIGGISPGPHTLTVRAVGFAQGVRTFHVPDPSGVYDIGLTPL